jgi:hypothetical protein
MQPDNNSGHWIQGAIKRPGALHRALNIPEGQKIPEKKIEKAEHSSNDRLRREANLAMTLKSLRK